MGKEGEGVHPLVKKVFLVDSRNEIIGWGKPPLDGGAAVPLKKFFTPPCNSRSENGQKWTLPRVKWVPPPSKIGANSLKMAKIPRELAPRVKIFPAAEGGQQIFHIAPWELTPQVTFFACPCMVLEQIYEEIYS